MGWSRKTVTNKTMNKHRTLWWCKEKRTRMKRMNRKAMKRTSIVIYFLNDFETYRRRRSGHERARPGHTNGARVTLESDFSSLSGDGSGCKAVERQTRECERNWTRPNECGKFGVIHARRQLLVANSIVHQRIGASKMHQNYLVAHAWSYLLPTTFTNYFNLDEIYMKKTMYTLICAWLCNYLLHPKRIKQASTTVWYCSNVKQANSRASN